MNLIISIIQLNKMKRVFQELESINEELTTQKNMLQGFIDDIFFSGDQDPMISKSASQIQHMDSESHNQEKQKKKANYNSQKHTVVTLQHILSISNFNTNSDEDAIIRKMWCQFLKTTRKTKQILALLFGCVNPQFSQDKKLFQRCNLEQILVHYPVDVVRSAQAMLREAACEQLTQRRIDEELSGRRIKCKQQFKVYLINFVNNLRERPLKTRNKKEKNEKIEKKEQYQQYLCFQ